MDHKTITLAYLVEEKAKINVDTGRLAMLGLKPGSWLKNLKDSSLPKGTIEINGKTYSIANLRKELLIETKGDSIAYLTDFLFTESVLEELVPKLKGCKTVICEAQYKHSDWELAQKYFHMTVNQSAELARRIEANELVLFHISDRYNQEDWQEMLNETRKIFLNTRFPDNWII
jgi:ribonuclease Z